MKTTAILMAILIPVLLCSCEKEPILKYGFDSEFNKDPKGMSIMAVKNNSGLIALMGTVKLDNGELLIELADPDGITVFSLHSSAPGRFDISRTFRTKNGYWMLQYTSLNGSGSIDLHINTN